MKKTTKTIKTSLGKLPRVGESLRSSLGWYAASAVGRSVLFLKVDEATWNSTGVRKRIREEIAAVVGKDLPVIFLPHSVDYAVAHVG